MCQLCSLEHKTKVYMDTKKFIILDCKDCCIPMAVWKEHTMSIREEYEEMMESMLHIIARTFYQSEEYYIDKEQRKIFDHLHWHARNEGFEHG